MQQQMDISFRKAGFKNLLFYFRARFFFLFLAIFFLVNTTYAKLNIDSVKKVIELTENDTSKAKLWNIISLEYSYTGYYELAERAAFEALDLSKRNSFERGIGDAYYHLGISFSKRAQFDKAIEWFLRAITVYDKIGNQNGKGFSIMLIGVIDYDLKNYSKAEEEYKKALEIFTKAGSKSGIANCLVNLGYVYADKGEYDKAIDFSQRAYTLFKNGKSYHGMAECLSNIANVYSAQYRLNDSLGNKDIAEEYLARAVSAFRENIKTYDEIAMPVEESQQYLNLFNLFLKKDDATAKRYLDTASFIINNVNSLYNQYVVSHAYYRFYIHKKDSAKALHYFLEYSQFKDSVFNVEKAEKVKAMNVQIKEIEKQKEIDLLTKEKEKRILVLWGTVLVSGLLLVFLFLLYSRYKDNKKANTLLAEKNKTIEAKNKEIIDSINYARRIQAALITSEKYIQKSLEKLIKFKS
jgi:tetratricopeptide (TPR) repeat protein